MLVLCAIGSSGDAFWDRAEDMFPATGPSGIYRDRHLRFSAEDFFGENPDGDLPASGTLTRLVRTRLPVGRLDALTVGVAVAATEPGVMGRLNLLLRAFKGISQVPALVHLFVLGPDAYVRYSAEMGTLVTLCCVSNDAGQDADGPRSLDVLRPEGEDPEAHCRDICWVRVGPESKGVEPEPLVDSRVRAAVHCLFATGPHTQQVQAILQARDTALRDTSSCRLFFDRARWLQYGAADLTIRLAARATVPSNMALVHEGKTWVFEEVYPALSPDPPVAPPLMHVRALPENLGAAAEAESESDSESVDWTEPVAAMRKEARTRVEDECAVFEKRLGPLAESNLPALVNRVASSAADPLRSLADASMWADGVNEELESPEPSPPRKAMIPYWLKATNDLLMPVFGLKVETWGFDLGSPASWPARLDKLEGEVAQDSAGEKDPPLRQCASVWISKILPPLVVGKALSGDPVAMILDPVEEMLGTLGEKVDEELVKAQSDRETIEAKHPKPEKLWGRIKHRLFTTPGVRKAKARSDAKHRGKSEQATKCMEEILRTANAWLAIAIRQRGLEKGEAWILEQACGVLSPVRNLRNRFKEKAKSAKEEKDGTSKQAFRSEDWLALPHRDHMDELVPELDPDVHGWIEEATPEDLPIGEKVHWLDMAGSCLEILPQWAMAQAIDFPMNLGIFLYDRFPETKEPLIAELARMASKLLLPLKHQRAERRCLHQEWHLPEDEVYRRDRIYEKYLVEDDQISTVPTSFVRLTSPSFYWLELHLHVLGFEHEDFIHWELFSAGGSNVATSGDSEEPASKGTEAGASETLEKIDSGVAEDMPSVGGEDVSSNDPGDVGTGDAASDDSEAEPDENMPSTEQGI